MAIPQAALSWRAGWHAPALPDGGAARVAEGNIQVRLKLPFPFSWVGMGLKFALVGGTWRD